MDQQQITDVLKTASDQISAGEIADWSGEGWSIAASGENFVYTYTGESMAAHPDDRTGLVNRDDIALIVATLVTE